MHLVVIYRTQTTLLDILVVLSRTEITLLIIWSLYTVPE